MEKNFVFSLICATFGGELRLPIEEDHPQNPINPYGRAKFMGEWILKGYDRACEIRSCVLRNLMRPVATKIGNGNGFSVRDVIRVAEEVSGKNAKIREEPRRPGDPAALVGSGPKAGEVLGWKPMYGALKESIGAAWLWESAYAKA